MHVKIELSKTELRQLVLKYLNDKLDGKFKAERLRIQVKSQQNYKSEWEDAEYRAVYEDSEL